MAIVRIQTNIGMKKVYYQYDPKVRIYRRVYPTFGKRLVSYLFRLSYSIIIGALFFIVFMLVFDTTSVKDLTIENSLAHYKAKKGDVFYLPAGRVHAIGAGSFILEIQENSDITYRIYDYDRIDINGRKRELHIDQAKQAIDYTVFDNYKTEIDYKDNESTTLVACDHFFTAMIDLTAPRHIDVAKDNAFRIFVCVEGFVSITDSNNKKTLLKQGETVLVPAEIEFVELTPRGNSKVVEITA